MMQNLPLVVNEVLQDHERLAVGKVFNKLFLRSVIMKKLSKSMLMTALICGTIVPVLCGGASVYAAENILILGGFSNFRQYISKDSRV